MVTFKVFMQLQYVGFGTIKKNRKKPTTQYNTITQYNFLKFKVFCGNRSLLLYCIVLCSGYCIVFNKTIKGSMNSIVFCYCIVLCCFRNNLKKTEKTNNTIQHNNTIQFGKI